MTKSRLISTGVFRYPPHVLQALDDRVSKHVQQTILERRRQAMRPFDPVFSHMNNRVNGRPNGLIFWMVTDP